MPALSILLMDTYNYFKKHLVAFCILVLPFALITNGIALSFNEEDGSGKFLLYVLFILTIYPFYKGAILYYIAYSFDGRRVPFSQLYQIPAKTWFSFVLMNMLLGLALLAGFIVFILPGLYLMARFSFTEIYCVLYKEKVTDSIRLGWHDTQDNYWVLFKGLVILFACTTGGIWVIEALLSSVGITSPALSFVFSVVEVVLSMLNTVFVFRVFTVNKEKLVEIQNIE